MPSEFDLPGVQLIPGGHAPASEVIAIAGQMIHRNARRKALVKELMDEDMLGLECAQTIELEELAARDISDGHILAGWIYYESIHGTRLR